MPVALPLNKIAIQKQAINCSKYFSDVVTDMIVMECFT